MRGRAAAQAETSWALMLLHMGVPALILAAASAMLRKPAAERAEEAEARRVSASTGQVDDGVRVIARARRPTIFRQWWRLIVLCVALLCYNWILWSDWLFIKSRRGGAFDRNPALGVVWQLVWLLLAVTAVVLNAALDFVHCALVSALLYASFVAACAVELCALWARSREARHGGVPLGPSLDDLHGHGGMLGALADAQAPATTLGAHAPPAASEPSPLGWEGVSHEFAKAALSGLLGILLILVGAHRINRFERHSFVQQYLLWGKVRATERAALGSSGSAPSRRRALRCRGVFLPPCQHACTCSAATSGRSSSAGRDRRTAE